METGQRQWFGRNVIKHVVLDKKLDLGHAIIRCHTMEANTAKEVRLCLPLAMSFIVRVSNFLKDMKVWYHQKNSSNMKYKRYIIYLQINLVNGQWSSWSNWSKCNHSCGEELSFRTRNCSNPESQYGGYPCYGLDHETRPCPENDLVPPCKNICQMSCCKGITI